MFQPKSKNQLHLIVFLKDGLPSADWLPPHERIMEGSVLSRTMRDWGKWSLSSASQLIVSTVHIIVELMNHRLPDQTGKRKDGLARTDADSHWQSIASMVPNFMIS
ncbi:hypothetical protein AWENTII_001184 [Aspergillus wentii]